MPQHFKSQLNRTVYGALTANGVPPHSVSVRLSGLHGGTYAKIYTIAWGIDGTSEIAFDAFDYVNLSIIRGDVFDVNYTYLLANVAQDKDLVYGEVLAREKKFQVTEFFEPLKLGEGNDATSYLIIVPAPRNITDLSFTYNTLLTVRGEICRDGGIGVHL